MDKFNIDIDRFLKKATALKEKSQLDLDTAEFLDKEAIKLENIVDNPNTLPEDKEAAMVKLEVLHKRILMELNENTNSIDDFQKILMVSINDIIIESEKSELPQKNIKKHPKKGEQ